MRVSIIKQAEIRNMILPTKVSGSYWVTDYNEQSEIMNIINIEAVSNQWIIHSNDEFKLIQNNLFIEKAILEPNKFYFVKGDHSNIVLYVSSVFDSTYIKMTLKDNTSITIGNSDQVDICYHSKFISGICYNLIYQNKNWTLQKSNDQISIYVNNEIHNGGPLQNGDVIFLYGLKVVVVGDMIMVNNPNNSMNVLGLGKLATITFEQRTLESKIEIKEEPYYKEEDYFLKAPRLRTNIEKFKLKIDQPPQKENDQEMPIIYTVGPMLTMGMTSMVTMSSTVIDITSGKRTFGESWSSLLISGAMLVSMILWPSLSKRYERRQKKKREKMRQQKYKEYLQEKKKIILSNIEKQRQVLEENIISPAQCVELIQKRSTKLWERKKEQNDFLTFRIGRGSVPLEIEIDYPEEHFTMEDDNLKKELDKLLEETRWIENVPLNYSFLEKNKTAVIGMKNKLKPFVDNLLIQLMTFHSYDQVKIVILTNDTKEKSWDYLKKSLHCFNNDKSIRFFASNKEDMKEVSNYLQREFLNRKFRESNGEMMDSGLNYRNFSPYYFIVTDDIHNTRHLELVTSILEEHKNLGFSILILDDLISRLPTECNNFISLGEKHSGIFEEELISDNQREFVNEINSTINMNECCSMLSNIPIHFEEDAKELPNVVSFLEMYNVGKVEQLNCLNRWKMNNPTKNLQAPVGVNEDGDVFVLDLHEKYHGPHGLVAGMTGSGKSEFIISYILSMAVNYHPYEVSFILIDYKGGGLAGAFLNKEAGIKLPHLVGTITNLDKAEMKRSLASIESELRRRQMMFNKARESLGESTIDIYKYQRLYRDGQLKEPISHLFIICDEFAELKSQQPEFMESLISAARIGRSLGIHLILATQKPTGVVDDQIWSNSKFRVCLKVQENSDSMEMIKRPDAAALKQVGRFYLQVGYNELFALGQSAYAGSQYYPSDQIKKPVDRTINFINNIGFVMKSIENSKHKKSLISQGEELPNILHYLMDIADQENVVTKQLWLDKIPNIIYLKDIEEKYQIKATPFNLDIVIGEYDDPNNQRQDVLTLPLSTVGNTIVYGIAGSGKNNVLNTLIYSICTNHSVDEVNLYVLDFGSEALRVFKDMPHVGDVIVSSDSEKMNNLLKKLVQEIEDRKKAFLEYNGDYQYFIKNSGKTLPLLVIMINNYEAFQEMYEQHEDIFNQLTREGSRYGIIFLITATTDNSIRYKLKQNFKQELVLEQNDPSDYSAILGNTNGVLPSSGLGRGLVKKDAIYEFQTAMICEDEKLNEVIKNTSLEVSQKYPNKAPAIRVLPKTVSLDLIKESLNGLDSVPIGIIKETLEIKNYNFKVNNGDLVSSEDISILKKFAICLMKELHMIQDVQTLVIDTDNLLEQQGVNNYFNSDFENVITKINEFVDSNTFGGNIVCMIVGLESLANQVDTTMFEEFMMRAKNINNFKFIFVDSQDKIKKYAYETWYSDVVVVNDGIWIGNGVDDQMVIKISKSTREMRQEVGDSFSWIVDNGKTELIKIVEE